MSLETDNVILLRKHFSETLRKESMNQLQNKIETREENREEERGIHDREADESVRLRWTDHVVRMVMVKL